MNSRTARSGLSAAALAAAPVSRHKHSVPIVEDSRVRLLDVMCDLLVRFISRAR
jgi:hypothetical protein